MKIPSCLGARLHVGFSDRLDDDSIRSVLFLPLLKRVTGRNGERFACAVESQGGDAIIVLPRRLQTPPVDAVPHDDVVITSTCSKRAECGVKCYGINGIHDVEILGFVGDAMTFEGIPRRHRVTMMKAQRRKSVKTGRTFLPAHREQNQRTP
jgi:hypothetical protein